MQLQVQIRGIQMVALLDTESTHNFIMEFVVTVAGVRLLPREGLNVVVANGDRLGCSGLVWSLDINIGGDKFQVDCYVIPLTGFDIILRVQWLGTLGPILWNFSTLQVSFKHTACRVMWHGIGTPVLPDVTLARICSGLDIMAALLTDFDALFQEPHGLPPQRAREHRIHLRSGTRPVAVWPYRYAQHQKDELERQCTDMLEQGIICPSSSAFSAPVLLLKKHDGSWRFCINYHALNDRTVKDKFPIPVVEELQDELQGAQFFTKLDLRFGYHQVCMWLADVEKIAFRTHQGLFEFLVMPFGLMKALATFKALMNEVL
ncbi:hypothetical protein E2562_028819 [Oryza meyeriana var. granulata]|uniref:Reverse transcriptase domain-containing protein n=1 Tax=Oryza meyeriana var. granulata TaxID=110450 RepID=A0A6G1FD22_9ORYZ|nr:hypothetical protein E2562_028819 [Oryza meyeriana var. granulata]